MSNSKFNRNMAQTVTLSFTDPRDNKTYKVIKIGNQIWLAENLAYAVKGSRCDEDNSNVNQKYGLLYDWKTAKIACPQGWHLPSDEEWQTLVNFAGGDEFAGTKLKATNGWSNGGNGTDDFGFSALPGGAYGIWKGGNGFHYIGEVGHWWSTTKFNNDESWYRDMGYKRPNEVGRHCKIIKQMFSVRCILN